MSIELSLALNTMAIGVGATFVMDMWAVVLKRTFNIPMPNYCFVGRWLCHMPGGAFRHNGIATASAKSAECAVGWIAHYGIGVLFAALLVLTVSAQWLQEPTLLPALMLGLATVAVPFFVMQPAFGLGIASSKASKPAQARVRSIMNHAVFGIGLYISALVIEAALTA